MASRHSRKNKNEDSNTNVATTPQEGTEMTELNEAPVEDLDVDQTQAPEDTETDVVEGASTEGEAAPAKESKSTRPPLEEGLVSPIEFQKVLAKPVDEGGRATEIRPQQVYSYIRNRSKNDPFPVHESNGRPGIKIDEALAWWDRKEQRVAERHANAEAKAAKAAAKGEAQGEQPVVEAEADHSGEGVVEAE